MPIVFAPAGPLSEASVQGGQAQQWSRDQAQIVHQQQLLAHLYEANARMHQGRGGGAGSIPQEQPQSPPLRYGMQPEQGGGYHQQQNAQPLVQAEVLRLQRLQTARSLVNEQVQNGEMTGEEGRQFMLRLNTGIDPLQARQEQARTAQIQQATTQAMHQHAQQVAWSTMGAEERSQHIQNLVHPVTNDEGETIGHFFIDPETGRMSQIRDERPQPAERGGLTPQLLTQMYHQSEQSVLAEARQHATALTSPANMPAYLRTPEAIQAEVQRRYNARRQAAGAGSTAGGGTPSRPGTQVAGEPNPADLVAARLPGGQPGGAASPNDPGMVSTAPPERTALSGILEDVGQLNPFAIHTTGRFGHGDVFEELRRAPRPAGPQHHNAPAGVPQAEMERVRDTALRAWNNAEFRDRANNPRLKQIGRIYDLLTNAVRNRRSLTRHELAHHRRLLEGLEDADRANLNLEPAPPGGTNG